MQFVSPGQLGVSSGDASASRLILCACTKSRPHVSARPVRAARSIPLARTRSRRYSGARVGEPVDCVFAGIPVRVVRKRVKNTSLRIARDGSRVDVSAPACVPLSDIEAFVVQKRAWIERRLAEAAASPAARAERATPDELAEWRDVVSACVPVLVEAWEPVMGVKAGRLDYRNMKSRWGSCQPSTGRICINIRLALYPPECLEYVVVHELCHLLVPGHGEPFRRLMDRYMPDWKVRRDKLR
ncbi:DUF45 domain-containing protein [Eggerthellaceae bacterium zg-893]|nr:DUF45 domain-containing protein [Eggerthellaceae bacterium zg-893]